MTKFRVEEEVIAYGGEDKPFAVIERDLYVKNTVFNDAFLKKLKEALTDIVEGVSYIDTTESYIDIKQGSSRAKPRIDLGLVITASRDLTQEEAKEYEEELRLAQLEEEERYRKRGLKELKALLKKYPELKNKI